MDDTENKEQEPQTDSPPSDPNATSSDSSDELGSAEIDPPIIVQGGGSGNP